MLPLNCTVASLGSDAVHIVLRAEHLAVAVALNISSNSSEVLSTVCRGPGQRSVSLSEKLSFSTIDLLPRSCAGDLPGKNVVGLGCCISATTPCEGHGDGVGGSCPKFSVH